MKKRTRFILIAIAAILIAAFIGAYVYVSDYYPADDYAVNVMSGTDTVKVETDGQYTTFVPTEPTVGFIFYPGGKVEHKAYAPLMSSLAKKGILCVLVEMPFKLAVLDKNAADGVYKRFPAIKHWYIGGHSLGGSMAASYASDHSENLDGLILLAAYSTDKIPSDMSVLSLYGSEDKVLNLKKYADYRSNLPETTKEIILEGGNHSGFGNYGHQSGDGVASLSPEEQRQMTVEHIVEFIKK